MIFAVICLLVCLERKKREERKKRHQEQREGSEFKKKKVSCGNGLPVNCSSRSKINRSFRKCTVTNVSEENKWDAI